MHKKGVKYQTNKITNEVLESPNDKIQKDSSQVKQTNHQTDVTDDNEMDEVGVEEMDEIIKVNEDILKVKNDEIEKLNTDNDILTKELNRIKRILPAMSKEIDRLRSKQ